MSVGNIKLALLDLADAYGDAVSESRIAICAEALSGFGFSEVRRAIKEILCDPTVTRFPPPAVIASRIRPNESALAAANEAANRIVGAMDKFGWNNEKEARAYIGELGWAVVDRQGSWESLCENTKAGDIPILKAQWREAAKAIHERAKLGIKDLPPSVPLPANVRPIIGELVAKLSLGEPTE